MSTILSLTERLQKIIDAFEPQQVVHKLSKSKSSKTLLNFDAIIAQKSSCEPIAEDKNLQDALQKYISEAWDAQACVYTKKNSPDILWSRIKNNVINVYWDVSNRCKATKTKTENFIRDIKIDDKFLPNYVIQVFLKINSPQFASSSNDEQKVLFEQFESLRRTYGKRK